MVLLTTVLADFDHIDLVIAGTEGVGMSYTLQCIHHFRNLKWIENSQTPFTPIANSQSLPKLYDRQQSRSPQDCLKK